MDDINNDSVISDSAGFVSAWSRRETPIDVAEYDELKLYSHEDECGIMLTGSAPFEFIKKEAAFLFGNSPDELYFRPNFSMVVKVGDGYNADESTQIKRKLYNLKYGAFSDMSGMMASTENGIEVYKCDALTLLRPSIEEKDRVKSTMNISELDTPNFESILMDTENSAEGSDGEKEHDKTTVRLMSIEQEIESAVDGAVEKEGGNFIARFRPGVAHIYDFDIATLANRCFIVVHGNFLGWWRASESAFWGCRPCWVGKSLRQRPSPIFQAVKCGRHLEEIVPRLMVETLVVLPSVCIVLNEDEMFSEIHDKYSGGTVVRTWQSGGSKLISLQEHLDSLPPLECELPQMDTAVVEEKMNQFIKNPDNWNK